MTCSRCEHKRTTKNGPSPALWALHKDEIIRLYLSGSLPQLKAEMQKRYKFYASKRMYDARFKKWNVKKNMTNSQNPCAPRRKRQVGAQHDHIDDSKLDVPAMPTPVADQSTQSVTTSVEDVENRASPQTDSPSSSLLSVTPSGGSDIIYTPSSERSLNMCKEEPMTKDPVMFFSTIIRNEEFLLKTMDIYLTHRINTISTDVESTIVTDVGSTPASKLFWSNIENGIYLWKMSGQLPGNQDRACKALQQSQSLARSALVTEPYDFLRKVFLVLSPINTSVQPPLRRLLLRCIARDSGEVLGSSHLLTLICELLLREESLATYDWENDEPAMLCRSALYHMQTLTSHHLGAAHEATCKVIKSIVTTERRSGQYQRAKEIAENTYQLNKNVTGSRSTQTREAAIELAHVLASMGETHRALALHLEVVHNTPIPDRICVNAMECIAEQHISNDNFSNAADWLLKAQTIAMQIGNGELAILHITDKLEEALRRKALDMMPCDAV